MKNFKRALALLLICAMVVPMGLVSVNAAKVASWLWTTGSSAASSFEANADDTITVTAAAGEEYVTTAMTSTSTVALDGLTVEIAPEDLDFSISQPVGSSNHISVLWTEDEVDSLDTVDASLGNGLRQLIATNEEDADFTYGQPASKVGSKANGQAICIDLCSTTITTNGKQVISTVALTYYDGYYVNIPDKMPGYRYEFTARNVPGALRHDYCFIKQNYENIDFSNGVVINVRADVNYGYIISINGKDYYNLDKIAFFPDCDKNYVGHDGLTNDDYAKATSKYMTSLTMNRQHIDLKALKSAGEGYVTVGATAVHDGSIPCSYKVKTINGVPANQWEGTDMAGHVHNFAETSKDEATCTEEGKSYMACDCGVSYSNIIAALGHDGTKDETLSYDATCTEDGLLVEDCARCLQQVKTVLPMTGHAYDEWEVGVRATPETKGEMWKECVKCDYHLTSEYTFTDADLEEVYSGWKITGEKEYDGTFYDGLLDVTLNEDKSITIINNDPKGYTKAFSNKLNEIQHFDATITPLPYNGVYDESISIILTQNYDYYDHVSECIGGSKATPGKYPSLAKDQEYMYGHYHTGIAYADDYSFVVTLHEAAKIGTIQYGVEDDGYYDVIQYNIVSDGNYWAGGYSILPEPVKQGDPITFSTLYYYYEELYAASFGINTDYELWNNWDTSGVAGLSIDQEYYFGVLSYSATNQYPGKEVISSGSFTINSVCGENPIDFDGYAYEHDCSMFIDPSSYYYIGEAEWVEVSPATCTDPQILGIVCPYCADPCNNPNPDCTCYCDTKEGDPALGGEHTFGDYIYNDDATCTENGTSSAVCTKCGMVETKAEEDSALGHSFTNYTSNNDATCTEDGTKTAKCDRCDETDTVADEGSAKGHSFTNYVDDGNATCTEAGTKTAKCDNCDATDVQAVEAKGHTPGEWEVTKQPTIAEEGEQVVKCTVCGEVIETQAIDKLPPFEDVKESDWFYDAVMYCAGKGYVTGTSATTFNPTGKLTRAAFVVILARVAGADLSKYDESPFTDVAVGDWYGPAIIWAYENGYVNGLGDGTTFGPKNNMPRQQLATMFFRYAEKAGLDVEGRADLSVYTDGDKIASWAADACAWAVDAGLMKSTSTTSLVFAPLTTVTRAQAAQVFMNYDENLAGK